MHPPLARAYPRSRGETSNKWPFMVCVPGLSPLARGNLDRSAAEPRPIGPIPARAGKPSKVNGFAFPVGAGF